MFINWISRAPAVAALCFATSLQAAEVKVGVVLALTGPAASLGIAEKNTIEILPKTIGGEPVRFIVLDDASEPADSVRAARKLVDENVDLIIGPTTTSSSLALLEVIGPAKTAMLSLAGSSIIASPPEGNKAWSFLFVPPESIMAQNVFRDIVKRGKKTVAFIGFRDSFGDSFLGEMRKVAAEKNIKVLADERFGRTDPSVTAQVLRVISTNPDAIILGAAGTPGVAPILELRKLNYRGEIYASQGMANSDVLRVGGAALNGLMMSVAPVLVAEQLPDDNPIKPLAVNYVKLYEGKYGTNTRTLFGATTWDAYLIADKAVMSAKAAGAPGTPEFRTALRDAIANTKNLVGAQAVYSLSDKDHNGMDQRSQVLAGIKEGKWTYIPTE